MKEMSQRRSPLQKICIGVGFFFIIIGGVGVLLPGFMGLHLSTGHNLIHLASGILALWCGYSEDSNRSYNFCIAFGLGYGLIGLAGFILGEAGYPSVGFTSADEKLLRVIPNLLEFGVRDHVVHLSISIFLISSAYLWKKERVKMSMKETKKPLHLDEKVSFHRASEETRVRPPELGPEDLDHIAKVKERTDYEKRI